MTKMESNSLNLYNVPGVVVNHDNLIGVLSWQRIPTGSEVIVQDKAFTVVKSEQVTCKLQTTNGMLTFESLMGTVFVKSKKHALFSKIGFNNSHDFINCVFRNSDKSKYVLIERPFLLLFQKVSFLF